MRKCATRIVQLALAVLLMSGLVTAAQAETGAVRVVFTKGGFIIGVGGGRGVLTFRGNHYPFRVSGMSFGATIGASTTDLVGRALNMRSPGVGDIHPPFPIEANAVANAAASKRRE
jgi:hypothetical protein